MKFLLAILVSTFLISNTQAVECSGEVRELVNNETIVTKAALIDQNYPTVTKLELDINDAYFSAQINSDDVLAIISLGPDYTTGNLSNSSFNSFGHLKLSYVTSNRTFILECQK